MNLPYDHTFKLFTANLKHFLRNEACYCDILRMYQRVSASGGRRCDEEQMLQSVYAWLAERAEYRHKQIHCAA